MAARSVLQHFLDDFVSESLLPRVMADAKALTQPILSQKSAFLPSSTLLPQGGGAYVLQVAPAHAFTQHTAQHILSCSLCISQGPYMAGIPACR